MTYKPSISNRPATWKGTILQNGVRRPLNEDVMSAMGRAHSAAEAARTVGFSDAEIIDLVGYLPPTVGAGRSR
jgi:hypothetical protein